MLINPAIFIHGLPLVTTWWLGFQLCAHRCAAGQWHRLGEGLAPENGWSPEHVAVQSTQRRTWQKGIGFTMIVLLIYLSFVIGHLYEYLFMYLRICLSVYLILSYPIPSYPILSLSICLSNLSIYPIYPIYLIYLSINGVGVSSRISGRSTPLRRTDFLARKFFDFDERLLLSTPSFSTEQLLETSESGDPDFLCSLSAQNPGA